MNKNDKLNTELNWYQKILLIIVIVLIFWFIGSLFVFVFGFIVGVFDIGFEFSKKLLL